MTLSTRLTVAMVLLVIVTATAVGVLSYRNIQAVAVPRALERINTHARLLGAELDAAVHSARADVIGFRSAVALDGIMRATLNGGTDPRDGTTVAHWKERFASRLAAELVAKPNYSHFRVIGVADGGREILRVDRSGPDGTIPVVPDIELQPRATAAISGAHSRSAAATSTSRRSSSTRSTARSRHRMSRPCTRWRRSTPRTARRSA